MVLNNDPSRPTMRIPWTTIKTCTCCGHAFEANPLLGDRCWSCDAEREMRASIRAGVELVKAPARDDAYLVLVLGYVHGGTLPLRDAVIHHAQCAAWSEEQIVSWFEQRAKYPTWYAEQGQVAA